MGTRRATLNIQIVLLILVLLLCLSIVSVVGYASKAKRPTLDIDANFTIPDSIIAGQPFSVKFEFEMLDTIPWHTEYPDKVWIWFKKGYSLLSGSTTWQGYLQRGSVVSMEFMAMYPEDEISDGLLFGAHITTGRSARSDGSVFPYTDNYIRSDYISLKGRQPIDPLDTMTLNGEPMPENMKAAMRKMTRPHKGRRVGRVCVTLSEPDSITTDGISHLGEYGFSMSGSERYSRICFRRDRDDMERVLPAEMSFSVENVGLELLADSAYQIKFDAPVDTCTLDFTYDDKTYRILLRH